MVTMITAFGSYSAMEDASGRGPRGLGLRDQGITRLGTVKKGGGELYSNQTSTSGNPLYVL